MYSALSVPGLQLQIPDPYANKTVKYHDAHEVRSANDENKQTLHKKPK